MILSLVLACVVSADVVPMPQFSPIPQFVPVPVFVSHRVEHPIVPAVVKNSLTTVAKAADAVVEMVQECGPNGCRLVPRVVEKATKEEAADVPRRWRFWRRK